MMSHGKGYWEVRHVAKQQQRDIRQAWNADTWTNSHAGTEAATKDSFWKDIYSEYTEVSKLSCRMFPIGKDVF